MSLAIPKPWPDPKYFYAAPTYGQAERVAWERLKVLCPPHWVVSTSNLTIKTIFGSELFIIGLDSPERIEGLILDGGVIDENSDIKPFTFDRSVGPTLVTRRGWCWFIGVPKRFGVGATEYRDRYMQAARGELTDTSAFTWPSAGIVPEDEIKRQRTVLDPKEFDELYNASWLTAGGGVFYSFDRNFNVRPCTYDSTLPLVVTSDFNVDPMCWIIGHVKGVSFEIVVELLIRDTNTPACLDALIGRYGNHTGGFQMYGDASGRARRTSATASDYNHIANDPRLKALGRTMHYTTSNPSVVDRFARTNARLCSASGVRHVFIDASCKNLIRDLEVRCYRPGTREPADGIDVGHMTDALGYFLFIKYPGGLNIENKNIITISTGVR